MARIINAIDDNNYFNSNDDINDKTDYTNKDNDDDDDDDDRQADNDDEYLNNGTPISNEDIANELLIESFNVGR